MEEEATQNAIAIVISIIAIILSLISILGSMYITIKKERKK
jgi:hypothetical protein